MKLWLLIYIAQPFMLLHSACFNEVVIGRGAGVRWFLLMLVCVCSFSVGLCAKRCFSLLFLELVDMLGICRYWLYLV